MIFNPVESSVIARVGYDVESLHLRTVMTDGSVYHVAPCSHAEFAYFMDAPSKGAYWHRVFAGRAYRAGEEVPANSGENAGAQIKLREPEQLTHANLAEGCCARHLSKASLSGALDRLQPFECPKCGTTYWPKPEGPVVNWEARVAAMVFRI